MYGVRFEAEKDFEILNGLGGLAVAVEPSFEERLEMRLTHT